MFGRLFGSQKVPVPPSAKAAAPPPKPAAPAGRPVNAALADRKAAQDRLMADRKEAQDAKRAEQQAAIQARKDEQAQMREAQLAKRMGSGAPAPPPARAPPTPPPKKAAPGLRPPPPASRAPPPAPKQAAAPAPPQRIMSAPRGAPVAKDVGRLKFADQIGQDFPKSWVSGQDYVTGDVLAAGDLVGVSRSDGSVKFGQIVGKAGFLGVGNSWEVCVQVNRNGAPQSSRTEDGGKLLKVNTSAMIGVVTVGETPERSEPIEVQDGTQMVEASGFKTNFFQRLGSMSPTIGGSQRDKAVPLAPPKRVVPAPPTKAVIDASEFKAPPAKPAAAPAAAAKSGGGFFGGLFGGASAPAAAPAKPAAPPLKKAPAPPAQRAPVAAPKKVLCCVVEN